MTIRKATLLLNFCLVCTLLVMAFEVSMLFKSLRDMMDANACRVSGMMLGDELRSTSRALTSHARVYAQTGNHKALQAYYDVVDVRAGKKARPAESLVAPNQGIALMELLKNNGVSAMELSLIDDASRLSNILVGLEEEALHAVTGVFKDMHGKYTVRRDPDRVYATRLVFGAVYQAEVAKIMEALDTFSVALDKRTKVETVAYFKAVSQRALEIGMCLLFIAFFVAASILYTNKAVLRPLKETADFIDRVTGGDISAVIAVESNNEIGQLRRCLNEMLRYLQIRMEANLSK